MTSYKTRLKDITTIILDVDGVLTDSSVILLPAGEQVRTMSVRDGYAITQAVNHGLNICIISGGNYESVRTRLNYLGITNVHLGVKNKVEVLQHFLKENQIEKNEVLYMGDDIPDLKAMNFAGVKCCPTDAVEEIKIIADYVSPKQGGKGCVRDVLEQILKIQDKWIV